MLLPAELRRMMDGNSSEAAGSEEDAADDEEESSEDYLEEEEEEEAGEEESEEEGSTTARALGLADHVFTVRGGKVCGRPARLERLTNFRSARVSACKAACGQAAGSSKSARNQAAAILDGLKSQAANRPANSLRGSLD